VGEDVGALFLCMSIPQHGNKKKEINKERRERKRRREQEIHK
jgi:hypothetical protein